MKIFRVSFIVFLLVSGLAAALGLYLLRGWLAEGLLKSWWPEGTDLRLGGSEVRCGRDTGVVFTQARIVDQRAGEVLLQWEKASLLARTRPFGFGEVYVSEMEVSGIVIGRALTAGERTTVDLTGKETKPEEGGGLGLDFKGLDHREILARLTGKDQLDSEKKVAALQKDAQEAYERWKDAPADLEKRYATLKDSAANLSAKWQDTKPVDDVQRDADALSREAQDLAGQKVDAANPVAAAAQVQRFQALKDRAKELGERIKAVKKDCQADLDRVKAVKEDAAKLKAMKDDFDKDRQRLHAGADGVRGSAKADLDMMKKELDPKSFDAAKVTRLLLGREYEEKLLSYVGIWEKIKPWLPEKKPKEVRTKTWSDDPVVYPRPGDLPAFTVAKMRITAARTQPAADGPQVVFGGEVRDLSSDERLLGRPLGFLVEGSLGASRFRLDGAYSTLEEKKDQRRVRLLYEGVKMDGRAYGPEDMRVLLSGGEMRLEMELDLSGLPEIKASGAATMAGVTATPGPAVKEDVRGPLLGAVQKLLAKPVPFSAEYTPPRAMRLKFGQELDDLLKDAVRQYLAARLQAEGAQLEARYRAVLEAKIEGLVGKSAPLQSIWEKFGQKGLEGTNLTDGLVSGLDAKGQERGSLLDRLQGEVAGILSRNLAPAGPANPAQGAAEGKKEDLEQKAKDKLKKFGL